MRTYKQIAENLIAESIKSTEEYRKEKLQEIEREKISDEEKKSKIEQLDKVCEESKIKRVTVGKGFWPISQSITDYFSDRPVHNRGERVSPREKVSYIYDSDVQFIVAEIDGLEGELYTNSANVEVKYRDERKIVKEIGENIENDTIFKIKQIENEAHKNNMKEMQDVHSVYDLANVYNVNPYELRIIHGEDWYYVYANQEDKIHVLDLARGKPRFDDERLIGSNEMGRALDQIMLLSINEGKEIQAELREDTSYLLLLELKEAGLIQQVGDEIVFEYGYSSDYDYFPEQKQKELLAKKEEIREKEANDEETLMHQLTFIPTEKYMRILKKRYAKEVDKDESR